MEDTEFQPLAWSEKEVKEIDRLFKKSGLSNNSVLVFEQANENALKTQCQQDYKYIHIASHSFPNFKNPKFSGIACSPPKDSSETEDGILFVNEIYNMNLKADLVVLSSCESGLGQLVSGEGLMGLNRSFIAAGTPNVLYSLWKVNDEKSSQLMIEFYRQILEGGKTYPAALRAAKLKMLEDEVTALPLYWSGFVLIGR